MVNMKLKQLTNDGVRSTPITFSRAHRLVLGLLINGCMAAPAMAQAINTGGLCTLYAAMKAIAGGAALIAIAIFVINSFFGKSSLVAEITVYVIMGCTVLVLAPSIVGAIGLAPACA